MCVCSRRGPLRRTVRFPSAMVNMLVLLKKLYSARIVAAHLCHPRKTLAGALVSKVLEKQNAFLEKCAVKLCDIQPNHNVLEVGFGPGIGLRCAYWRVQEGPGKVYGIDASEYMVNKAKKCCALEIGEQKVEVIRGLVTHLPFPDNFFDRLFHCNCFYFWPSLEQAGRELFRVMKPNGLSVTTLYLDGLKRLQEEGILAPEVFFHTDPLHYMISLETVGFKNVGVKYYTYKDKSYQAIYASKPSETELKERLEKRLATIEEEETRLIEMSGEQMAAELDSRDRDAHEAKIKEAKAKLERGATGSEQSQQTWTERSYVIPKPPMPK